MQQGTPERTDDGAAVRARIGVDGDHARRLRVAMLAMGRQPVGLAEHEPVNSAFSPERSWKFFRTRDNGRRPRAALG